MRAWKLRQILIVLALGVFRSFAQDQPFVVRKPNGSIFLRPYAGPSVAPIKLANSDRIRTLIRANHLYLTIQDAIALAIENNLDLEVDRYGPLLAHWAVERSEGGGALRGVPSGSSQVGSVDNGIGVLGTIASAGLNTGANSVGTSGGGGAAIQQIGPITQNLDLTLQNVTTFSHTSAPQPNTVISQTSALVDTQHVYSTTLQQGLLTGGFMYFKDYESYLKENAPSDNFNPAVGPHMDLYIQHNLLQGLGKGLNSRFIEVAKKNAVASREIFRAQLLDLVARVLHLYWDLVNSNDVLKARQRALEIAHKFAEDTKAEIQVGILAAIELPRAEAEVASRKQDLLIAQATVRQQENLLKQALTREQDSSVEMVDIVPLDRIQIPEQDDLPPLRDLVATALAKRPDLAASKIQDENGQISARGTTNALLPTAQGFLQTYDRGAAGTPQIVNGSSPNPYFRGGYGTALGQIVRRDFPNNRAGVYITAPLGNRVAQGDYGVEQLQLRQSDVSSQRNKNQIVVDIANEMVALRQARARYSAAVDTQTLQETLLKAEQNRFIFGATTISNLIIAQRSLSLAQTSELNAMAAYTQARVSLDQVLGKTLDVNHVALSDALKGQASLNPGVKNGAQ